ncbi:MAG: hypothetical protein HOW73_12730 [Polyangiaceae bacterium]|nr:hypothetical protein [Polyangiaceae bacterium]
MKLRTVLIASTAGVLSLGIGLFAGCGDDTTGTGGSGGGEDLSDVIYEAEATDEALEALVADTPKDEPEKAAVFDAPANDEAVPAAETFTFRWHAGGQAAIPRDLFVPARRTAHPIRFGAVEHDGFTTTARTLLEGMLSNVPSAHAHGTPVNGPGYFLVFSTADNAKLVRVFTLATEYTPDDTAWGELTGAGAPITATILSAEFEENRVLQDGGPWESAPLTFTIE